MNRSELVLYVAEATSLSKPDAQKAVDAVFEGITETLRQGNEARFLGFGSFAVQHSAAREGRNPRTGEKLQIAASCRPVFKAGKEFKDAVASLA
ncbi:MAG: HU family DNA-binding protein [Alphaproteobacteria bacterium]|nr:HU family DNA-binding protein [Alphaproteobacteria bacterium]